MNLETRLARLETNAAQQQPPRRDFGPGVWTKARAQRLRDELARRGLSYEMEMLRIKKLIEGDEVLSNPHFEAVRLKWQARRSGKMT